MKLLVPCLVFLGSCSVLAQPSPRTAPQNSKPPVYRIRSVMRPVAVMHYRHIGKPTVVDFVGTALMPKAHGEAKVYRGEHGYIVEAELEDMSPARQFGSRYMTYVLWGLTPEGKPHNLGELLVSKGKAKLEVRTDIEDFAMVITAEPYYAVSKPSDVVVLHNVSHMYAETGEWLPGVIQAPLDPHMPLDLYEARNAVSIAHQDGAGQYAPELFRKASTQLEQAEKQFKHSKDKQHLATIEMAREAIETAEAARTKTAQYLEKERARNARIARLKREAEAKAQGERAAPMGQVSTAGATEDAEEQDTPDAADAAVPVPEQEAGMAGEAAANAARPAQGNREESRGQLLHQLQTALDTRETPRGLVVTLSDVLFNQDQATLNTGAREKLAKICGILLAHPGLTVEVDGYAQAGNGEDGQTQLADRRAAAVRDYLIHEGIPGESISARTMGEAAAGASGNNAAGEGDRRVEMVVSGMPIGL